MQCAYLIPAWLQFVKIGLGNYYTPVPSLALIFRMVITKLKLKVKISKYQASYTNVKWISEVKNNYTNSSDLKVMTFKVEELPQTWRSQMKHHGNKC